MESKPCLVPCDLNNYFSRFTIVIIDWPNVLLVTINILSLLFTLFMHIVGHDMQCLRNRIKSKARKAFRAIASLLTLLIELFDVL